MVSGVKASLLDNHHRSAEAVLGKGRIVVVARGEVLLQLRRDGGLEDTLATTVDEYNLAATEAQVFAHRTLENTQLVLTNLMLLHLHPSVA